MPATVAAQQTAEWYQGKPIKDITFDGLRHVKLEDLAGVIEPYIGRNFNDDLFWELQGRLYGLEFFEVLNPTAAPADAQASAVLIRFKVTERPVVTRINFRGNKGLRTSELRDAITIKVNDVVNQPKLRIDEGAVTARYLEKGYPDATVSSETETGNNDTIIVTFVINEGEHIAIEGFHFEGNHVFSERTLRSQLSLKAKGILNDGAFQRTKLLLDRTAIVQYYHDRGYIDAEVQDVVETLRRDGKGNNYLTLTFRIHEGRSFTFGGITFSGNQIFSTKELNALVYSKVGDTVNARRLEADLQRVADLYFENGYIFNSIGRNENRSLEEGTISYEVPIIERGRAHIEHIIIRGNVKTREEVIRREIPLESGDIFSKNKVMDGMRNLYNLQFFSNVIPETPMGSADSLMDLAITVEEQPTTDIQLGITFSGSSDPDAFPMSGIFKWTDRNFRGSGNVIGAELNASPDVQSVSLEYTQRWLFGMPLSGGFDLTVQHSGKQGTMDTHAPFFEGSETNAFPDGFNSYEEYVNSNKLPASEYLMRYDQWYISLGFSTGYRWPTFLGNVGLSGGVRSGFKLNSYDDDLYRPFDRTIRENNMAWTPANSIWASLSLDQRDIYYDPSRGYYGSQRFGIYGILPGDAEEEHYIRTDTKVEWFATLVDWHIFEKWSFKAVFGIHSGLSMLFPQAGYQSITVESANQLSVDGMFIGRGWISERLNRGLALWENWAEIRIPLVPGILAWDFFFDAAAIADTPENVFGADLNGSLENRLRYSFGGGLRFAIPQFPFRFLFARRFKVVDGQVQWQRGAILTNDKADSGIDFVISFALSTY